MNNATAGMFFHALYGQQLASGHALLIWTLPDKMSYWHANLQQAAEQATNMGVTREVYFGVGLAKNGLSSQQRALVTDIIGIPGVWVDIDVAGEGHKKNNLPPDIDSAFAALHEADKLPTLTVFTGGGVHAYWCFPEPWIFADDDERVQAGQLVERWQIYIRRIFARHDWTIDSTHDLARVLRVPGTLSHKHHDAPIEWVFSPRDRYSISDLQEIARDSPPSPVSSGKREPNASKQQKFSFVDPPFEKLDALLENNEQFSRTWRRQRSDLTDQSPSGYDQALANIAVEANWSDDEIASLLMSFRRKYHEDLKRPDYFARTIVSAHQWRERETVINNYTRPSEAEPVNVLAALRDMLGVEISSIKKYVLDPPTYFLVTPAGEITIGEVQHLIGQAAFRNRFAAATGKLIAPFKAAQWHIVAQMLLDACDEIVIDEATTRGQLRDWLTDYLNDKRPVNSWEDAIDQSYPFTVDGQTYVFLRPFAKWLDVTTNERLTTKQLATLLRIGGAKSTVRHAIMVDGTRTTRMFWDVTGLREEHSNDAQRD